jgi:hypothetical protein
MERRDLRRMILDGEAKQKELKKKQQVGQIHFVLLRWIVVPLLNSPAQMLMSAEQHT